MHGGTVDRPVDYNPSLHCQSCVAASAASLQQNLF